VVRIRAGDLGSVSRKAAADLAVEAGVGAALALLVGSMLGKDLGVAGVAEPSS